MTGIIHYGTFLLTAILLNLAPGNDTIFILTRSISQGRKAGIVSALGIATGSLVHTTLAAFGLSLIIAKSILLFTLLKYAGAAYLIYLGIKLLIGQSTLNLDNKGKRSPARLTIIYRDAVLTNVLNPKVAMFFIAFLPQFIDPHFGSTVIPFFILGLSFTATGTVWCMILAIFSAALFSRLRKNQRFALYLNRFCGAVLITLGIRLALTRHK